MTPAQQAAALELFKVRMVGAALRGLDRGAKLIQRTIVESFSEKGRDPFEDPPNPAPGPLARRSGGFARSIKALPTTYAQGSYVLVVRASHPAARIHEYGGKTRPHAINPINFPDGVLRFNLNGKVVFAKYVFHPGSDIPARPYMRPGYESAWPKAEEELRKSLRAELARCRAEVRSGRG